MVTLKAKRIALVVIEVEALEKEDKSAIMSALEAIFKQHPEREIAVAAMKIFRADEAPPAP